MSWVEAAEEVAEAAGVGEGGRGTKQVISVLLDLKGGGGRVDEGLNKGSTVVEGDFWSRDLRAECQSSSNPEEKVRGSLPVLFEISDLDAYDLTRSSADPCFSSSSSSSSSSALPSYLAPP